MRRCGERIASHEVDIVIGTHALIEDKVQFAALGLVVTDEQHFGIAQRAALEKKGASLLDVLVMTATPIPRTMTLTVYGDLDVSQIRHLPPGRQPIRTFVRGTDRRPLIYEYVRKQIEAGRQARRRLTIEDERGCGSPVCGGGLRGTAAWHLPRHFLWSPARAHEGSGKGSGDAGVL